MGFAGQVFAARVAIGLALPSPQALNEAGSILVAGAGRIYEALAIDQKRRQMEDEGRLSKNLISMGSIVTNRTKAMATMMDAAVSSSLNKLDKIGQGAFSKVFSDAGSFGKQAGTYAKGFNEAVSQENFSVDIFDYGAMKEGSDAFIAMGKKIAKLKDEELIKLSNLAQKRLSMAQFEERQAKRELNLQREKMQTMSQEELKAGGAAATTARRLQEEYEARKANVDVAKEQQDVIKAQVGAVDDWNDEMGDAVKQGKEWNTVLWDGVHTMRTGFNNALRNSIALIVAFGYKLNQSTQELIEFERELLNANSVFNLTNDNLFEVGNTVIEFGNKFGIATQNGAQGLYQLASAGLTANEAMQVLPETLKLSMAVQGDHNTISKLTAQTIFGFGMEMEEAALVTDKFAYAIQKSLIEYQDLSSAVKFALPFFTSTGQSIDQLLGALQILTNRALEAGIAGRGLRQALAEFAESALDAEVGFRKMGVEILNAEGEMLQLTEIAAQFAAAVGPETASNTELLTTLIQDLNVRGATAFIHLVQASDEFTEAVENTRNAGGELDRMVQIQNESLQAQIQILKTNVLSIFALRDANYEGTEYINAFHEAIVNLVSGFQDLIIEEVNGKQQLTAFGKEIQNVAIEGVKQFSELVKESIVILQDFVKGGFFSAEMLKLLFMPLKVTLEIMKFLGEDMLKVIIALKVLNSILPIATLRWIAFGNAAASATAMGLGAKGAGLMSSGGALGRLGLMAGPIGIGLLSLMAVKAMMGANGGYIQPMAAGGGMYGQQPYIVGEQGPELFIPQSGGKLLNTMQTRNTKGRPVFNNANISIDSFGGLA